MGADKPAAKVSAKEPCGSYGPSCDFSQAAYEGSIPFARSNYFNDLAYHRMLDPAKTRHYTNHTFNILPRRPPHFFRPRPLAEPAEGDGHLDHMREIRLD